MKSEPIWGQSSLPRTPFEVKQSVGPSSRIIHEYDDADLVIVWDTVQKDLSPLVAALEEMVPSQEKIQRILP